GHLLKDLRVALQVKKCHVQRDWIRNFDVWERRIAERRGPAQTRGNPVRHRHGSLGWASMPASGERVNFGLGYLSACSTRRPRRSRWPVPRTRNTPDRSIRTPTGTGVGLTAG